MRELEECSGGTTSLARACLISSRLSSSSGCCKRADSIESAVSQASAAGGDAHVRRGECFFLAELICAPELIRALRRQQAWQEGQQRRWRGAQSLKVLITSSTTATGE